MKQFESLQEIEDYYVEQGLSGGKLREAIEGDEGYKQILTKRKKQLKKKINISDEEATRYVLSTNKDYEILAKIHKLENKNLLRRDKAFVDFIKTQLELDWRKPILIEVDKLLSKYD